MADNKKKKGGYKISKRVAAFTLSALMAGMSFLGISMFNNGDKDKDKDSTDHRHPDYSTYEPLIPSDNPDLDVTDDTPFQPDFDPSEIILPSDGQDENPVNNPDETPNDIPSTPTIPSDDTEKPVIPSEPVDTGKTDDKGSEEIPEDGKKPDETTPQGGDEDKEEHTHVFGDWEAIDDEYEQRLCSCGEVEKQLHQYKNSTVDKINSLDGTHTIITTKTCSNCNHVVELSETHKLGEWTYNKVTGKDERRCPIDSTVEQRTHECQTFKITKYDANYEYHECIDCGKTMKVKHKIQSKVLSDGSTLYTCTNDGCEYSKTIKPVVDTHSHSYKLERYDDSYEYYECSCGVTKKTSHQLSVETLADGSKVYTCQTPGCGYTKTVAPSHVHQADKFLRYEGDTEYWSCACGEEVTLSHNLGAVETEAGTFDKVRKCTTPGCGYEERTKHVHQAAVFGDYQEDEEHWICPECGTVILTTGHTLGAEHMASDSYDYEQDCETPGCDYKKVIPHSQRHKYEIVRKDETYEYWECVCGDDYIQTHSYDSGIAQGDGTYLQTCETCGYTRKFHTCERGRSVREDLMNDEGCYRYAYYCKICDRFLGYGDIVPHDTYEDDGMIYCWNCEYSKPAPSHEEEQIIDKNEVMILERKKKEKGLSNEK